MSIAEAVAVLRRGGLVAFPTETVYGLGADAAQPAAIRQIFAVKGRPPGRPLTVHLGSRGDPGAWGVWSAEAERLRARFWPGPLTLVLPRQEGVDDVITGGLPTVGLRVPRHPVALALLDAFGAGVAAPSANRSGRPSPTSATHVRADLGDAVFILDGGECPLGVESTVLSLAGPPTILRLGSVPRSELAEVLGTMPPVAAPSGTEVRPRAPVLILDADALAATATEEDAVLARQRPPRARAFLQAPEDPATYGRRLFASLRELDGADPERILVESLPLTESWEAIRARLGNAASR